jgi:hypothetical protein
LRRGETLADSESTRVLRVLIVVIGSFAAAVGCLVFIGGWVLGAGALKSVLPGLATMKVNTRASTWVGAAVERSTSFRRPVTVSLGIAAISGDTAGPAMLVHDCDSALYQAKGAGRNRVSVALAA